MTQLRVLNLSCKLHVFAPVDDAWGDESDMMMLFGLLTIVCYDYCYYLYMLLDSKLL